MRRTTGARKRFRILGWPLAALILGASFYVLLRAAGPTLDALPPLPGPLPGSKESARVEVQAGSPSQNTGGESNTPSGGASVATPGGAGSSDTIPTSGGGAVGDSTGLTLVSARPLATGEADAGGLGAAGVPAGEPDAPGGPDPLGAGEADAVSDTFGVAGTPVRVEGPAEQANARAKAEKANARAKTKANALANTKKAKAATKAERAGKSRSAARATRPAAAVAAKARQASKATKPSAAAHTTRPKATKSRAAAQPARPKASTPRAPARPTKPRAAAKPSKARPAAKTSRPRAGSRPRGNRAAKAGKGNGGNGKHGG